MIYHNAKMFIASKMFIEIQRVSGEHVCLKQFSLIVSNSDQLMSKLRTKYSVN